MEPMSGSCPNSCIFDGICRLEELSVGGTPLPSLFNDPYTSLVHRPKLMTHLESRTRF
uniref:Uncharacterized protein n=1 Tax=Anguilla anguilla TaxID=7936 RepID=A0A0E9X4W0_ANGAN